MKNFIVEIFKWSQIRIKRSYKINLCSYCYFYLEMLFLKMIKNFNLNVQSLLNYNCQGSDVESRMQMFYGTGTFQPLFLPFVRFLMGVIASL